MMIFMMNFATDLEHYNPQLQLNHYSRQTEELKKLFEKLTRNNTNQGKILDSIKAKLSENQSFLAGKFADKGKHLMTNDDIIFTFRW